MPRKIQIGDKWYVAATSASTEEQPQVLKNDETFAMFDRFGDIQALSPGKEGLYHNDTRYLSHQELTVDGVRPLHLGSSVEESNSLLVIDLMNPDLPERGTRGELAKGTLHIFRAKLAVARGVPRACARDAPWQREHGGSAGVHVRRRLRGPVRSARNEARSARRATAARSGEHGGGAAVHGARPAHAPHEAALRARAHVHRRRARDVRPATRPRHGAPPVLHRGCASATTSRRARA